MTNLPPGVTQRHIDEAFGSCAVCGQSSDDCICPECPVCSSYGDPHCYSEHGLTRTLPQAILRAFAEAEQEELERSWDRYAEEYDNEIHD